MTEIHRNLAKRSIDKEFTAYLCKDANPGFHNDSTASYDKQEAELAWKRTIDFLR
jgi:carboxymethylenebutenolidase